jgi:hypothetical protein
MNDTASARTDDAPRSTESTDRTLLKRAADPDELKVAVSTAILVTTSIIGTTAGVVSTTFTVISFFT